ncbi:MAG: tRNA pseudouridine(13) synthase TruD [archaeon]
MYIIKERPEDFLVEEIPNLKIKDKGDYAYFLLRKKEWETKKIVKEICNRLGINENRVNISGIKDKHAVTEQYISVYKINKENVEDLRIKDIELKFIGYGDERLRLGDIKENRFKIVVRNLDGKIKIRNRFGVENYFDDQRFRENNKILGKLLIKRDFKEFCKILGLDGTNFINSVRKIEKWKLIFYISSYQSYLFNEYLSEYIKSKTKDHFLVSYNEGKFVFSEKKFKNFKISILSFDSKTDRIYRKILEKENIKLDDFLIREMPELINEGNFRDAFLDVKLKYEYSKDELHEGKYKCLLEFSLKPGSYATIVVKKIFSKSF